MKRKIVEVEEIRPAVTEACEMPRPSLRQPLVLHLVEQKERDHRRPIDIPVIKASVQRLIAEDAGARA